MKPVENLNAVNFEQFEIKPFIRSTNLEHDKLYKCRRKYLDKTIIIQ